MRDLSKNILIILLALFLVLIDTTFFTLFSIGGVSIISSFAVLIIFSLIGNRNDFLIFSLSLIIFLTIFSSIPPVMLIISFCIVPALILYLRQNYLPEPPLSLTFVYYFFGNIFLGIFLILFGQNINSVVINSFIIFVATNSLIGVIFYYIAKKIRNNLQPGKQIKL